MATFEGTKEEFMRFLGSYFRIKVLFITRKYKQQIGMCEDCYSTSKTLEAAHIRGKERPLIIKTILSRYTEDQKVKVDLEEFEELFVAVHKPLESSIRILCTECHRKYDSLIQTPNYISTVQDEDKSYEMKATVMSTETINNSSINKSLALQLIRNHSRVSLDNATTIFSNISPVLNAWWLEPKTVKLYSELNLVLNHPAKKRLYHFRIPTGAINMPYQTFVQRSDKPYSTIHILVSTTKFVDRKGFDFTPFLAAEIPY